MKASSNSRPIGTLAITASAGWHLPVTGKWMNFLDIAGFVFQDIIYLRALILLIKGYILDLLPGGFAMPVRIPWFFYYLRSSNYPVMFFV